MGADASPGARNLAALERHARESAAEIRAAGGGQERDWRNTTDVFDGSSDEGGPALAWEANDEGTAIPIVDDGGTAKALTSRRGPLREADRVVAALPPAPLLVAFGVGSGLVVRRYLERHPAACALLVERGPRVVASILDHVDLSDLLDSGRIAFAWQPTGCQQALQTLYAPALQAGVVETDLGVWTRHSANARHFQIMRRAVATELDSLHAELPTLRRFGRAWLVHTIHNSLVGPSAALPDLRGREVVVCAAGPSLDEWAVRHRSAGESSCIVAVDTAVPALRGHQIAPDIVVSIDAQAWTALHLRDGLPDSSHVIADLGVPAALFARRAQRGGATVVASAHPLHRALARLEACRYGATDGAVGVTEAAVRLVRALGAATVTLVGADGSWPHARTYARGTYRHTWYLARSTRCAPVETTWPGDVWRHGRMRRVDDGTRVWSTPEMDARSARLQELVAGARPTAPDSRAPSAGTADVALFWQSHAAELADARVRLHQLADQPTPLPELRRALGAAGWSQLPTVAWHLSRRQTPYLRATGRATGSADAPPEADKRDAPESATSASTSPVAVCAALAEIEGFILDMITPILTG